MSIRKSIAHAGLSAALFLWIAPVRAEVVINEVHYDPADKTTPVEFIELFNSGPEAVGLTGWRLSGGIRFAFPEGARIDAGGFLVVAEAPDALAQAYGAQALGPWEGGLSNSGETLTLEDAGGGVADVVDYQSGYPWPSSARGGGTSMELVHPDLDNDLGGSWRSSRPPDALPELLYIAGGDAGWRLLKGTAEASEPVDAWRQPGFDASAWSLVKLPLGFGGVGSPGIEWATELADMQTNYSGVFLRRTFEVAAGEIPTRLALRHIIDDGFVAWVNGVEIFRSDVDGEPAFDSVATRASSESNAFTTVEITGVAGAFVEGTNVLAIQAFNSSLGGSDFGVDIEFLRAADEGGSPDPTPGRPNSVLAENVPPQTRQVDHQPERPKTGEAVTVTVKVTDADGVAEVSLAYQAVEPGGYVRLSDDAYATSWTAIPMRPVAGEDDVFAAEIPAAVQAHRRLVRYRITATDSAGLTVQVPYADDEQPNFAYFVYDGIPEWTAAERAGVTAPVTFPKPALEHLQVMHLLADASDVSRSQYTSAFEGRHFFGTLVVDGRVYDHIEFSNRGEFSTYQSGKNKWRFHFKRTHDLEARDNYGRKYRAPIKTMNLNACASPWVPVNRGMAGMEEALGFRLYALAGVPSPNTRWLQLRVVDDAAEAPADDQYAGDLWGLYLAVEYPDSRFLDERGLPDGNTYKIESGAGDKKNQGPTQDTGTRDWTSFLSASRRAQDTGWWKANMNLDAYFGFRAINRAVGNIDIREGWNHYFYHHPDGRWTPIPWDLDMLVMPETHWSGTIDQKACLRNDDIETDFRNRCRELLDLLFTDKGDFGGQVAQVVEELATIVNPPELALTMVDVDQFMWNYHPRSSGGHRGAFYATPKSQSFQGGTLRRVLATPDHEGFEKYLKDFTTDTDTDGWRLGDGDQNGYGFEHLQQEAEAAGVPATPAVTYSGEAQWEGAGALPLDQLAFEASAFVDPGGEGAFAGRQWRIGRISNPRLPGHEPGTPWIYEIEHVWQSGWNADPSVPGIVIPGDALIPGATYRVRSRVIDAAGRTSHWSPPVQFLAGTPDLGAYAGLRISEIMFYPDEATTAEREAGFTTSDFEFIEFFNAGAGVIDLSRLLLTEGVDYAFADGDAWLLPAGGYGLVVRNRTAFAARHGGGAAILGAWGNDKLSNSGETVALGLAGNGDPIPVLAVTYDVVAPWPAAVRGQSLVWDGAGEAQSDPATWLVAPPSPGGSGSDGDSEYEAWARFHFGAPDAEGAAPQLDPDADGFANAVEFALVSLPGNPGSMPRIDVSVSGGQPVLTFIRRTRMDNFQVLAEQSTTLAGWEAVQPALESLAPVDAMTQRVTWTMPAIEGDAGGSTYLRLRIAE